MTPDLRWPEGPTRLQPLLRVKGLDRTDLMSHLHLKRSRVDSWLCGARRPSTEAGLRLANFLDVPLDYLYGGPSCSHLANLGPEEVATRASLDILLLREEARFSADMRDHLRSFIKSAAAPRSVKEWQALISDIVEPSFHFALQRQELLRRMLPKGQSERRTGRRPKSE